MLKIVHSQMNFPFNPDCWDEEFFAIGCCWKGYIKIILHYFFLLRVIQWNDNAQEENKFSGCNEMTEQSKRCDWNGHIKITLNSQVVVYGNIKNPLPSPASMVSR